MALCWPLKMPPPAKAVLISLADNANDSGFCWPSIDAICERTCFGRTAVIDAIKWLEETGFLVGNRQNGRKTTYTVVVANQSATRTSPPGEPVRQAVQTSPPDGRDQSATRTLTVNNRHKNRQEIKQPREVPDQVWSDFVEMRKAKNAPLSATALAGIEREARKAGLTLAEAMTKCCERGWRGFDAKWLADDKPAARAPPPRRSAATESFLALTGRLPNEVIDVETTARRLD